MAGNPGSTSVAEVGSLMRPALQHRSAARVSMTGLGGKTHRRGSGARYMSILGHMLGWGRKEQDYAGS
jgi:hypothetical protein